MSESLPKRYHPDASSPPINEEMLRILRAYAEERSRPFSLHVLDVVRKQAAPFVDSVRDLLPARRNHAFPASSGDGWSWPDAGGQAWRQVPPVIQRPVRLDTTSRVRGAIVEARRRARFRVLLYMRLTRRQEQLGRVSEAIHVCEDSRHVPGRMRKQLSWHQASIRNELLLAQIRFDADDLLD